MTLYTLSIRRPVLATVMATVIVIFGAIGFFFLGVREYPAVDPPIISVTTSYRGANADVIDAQITEPLEEEINSAPGIKTLTSVSRPGRSTITAEFDLDVDLERAANDVRSRVSRALPRLPDDVEQPSVEKSDADAPPIVFLNISSPQRNLMELTELADDLFKERLQTISGVSSVDIWGDKTRAMRLWLEPRKLAAYQLTPLDVRDALARENVELPAGRITGQDIELTVRTMSRLESVEEFSDLIVKQEGGRVVRLRDVGRAAYGPVNQRTILKRDGVAMVGVVLRPLPGANYISIVDEFYRRVEQIKRDLPADVSTAVGFDTTTEIRDSIAQVRQTIFIAFVLVVLVIFLFLRDWRSTIIPLMVIPVSLIGAFFVMYLFGFSINVLTLLALVLAIGLVVDDAIVVLENIYAKIEEGMNPVEAGITGTREIFFAVIATSLSLVAVFLPIIFLGGLTGQLFQEFGLVIAGAVLISSFAALTLTPMLSTKLLKQHDEKPWFYRKTEPFFEKMTARYRSSLEAFMARKGLAFAVMAACIGVTYVLYTALPQKLAPLEDRSRVGAFAVAREGATFDYMDNFMDRLIALVQDEVPESEAIITITSPGFGASTSVNSGFMRLILKDPEARERSQMQIADVLSQKVNQLDGARVRVSQEQTISVGGGQGDAPVQFVLQAPSQERLREVLPEFMEAARQRPEFAYTDVNLKFTKPELRVRIDRNRADNLGISARDIGQTLQLALSEQRLGYFIEDGEQREIIAQVEEDNRDETLDLAGLYVRTAEGKPVLLDNLVTIEEAAVPPQLFRFNRFRSATVSAELAPGTTIPDGIRAMREIANETLDESFSTALDGPARDFTESSNQLVYVFLLAILLIYLILAAQFESFRDPFTILLTVPLALVGALLFLWYFGQSINIFSQIGIVMLIGLVTKNGILIVEFANQRKAAGRTVREAIKDAAEARFRPILMTACSTILGVLPIALSLGAGGRSRIPMGIAVIGGLLIGTALALYVIPAMYTFLTSEEAGPVLAADAEDEAVAGGDGTGGNGAATEADAVRMPDAEAS